MEPSQLGWKWILEKLLDCPDLGVALINEVITSHVPDIEEPHCRALLERVALRNLEEMVVMNQIDVGAIPLMKALTGQDLGPGTSTGSSVKQRFINELVLRVQTEVVLSAVREGVEDWPSFESELASVFRDAEEDNRMLDRKRELSALLRPKNQTKATVSLYLEKYALRKLRDDLFSFIEEKKKSFKTMVLVQMSSDFLDANGKLFVEELDEAEKPTKVAETGHQEHGEGNDPEVGQEGNSKGKVAEDEFGSMRPTIGSGKKRLRRKLLPLQDDDDEDEVEECSAGVKKARTVPSSSIVNPLKTLVRQGVSELAVPHENGSLEAANISPKEPNRKNKYVIVSDVESDAETQVVHILSTDDEVSLIEEGDGDMLNRKEAHSSSENESDRCHLPNIEETEPVRKETIVERRERKILVDEREELSTDPPEVEVPHQEGNEELVAENESIPMDSQDIYEVDFLDVGTDGHEEFCHMCGDGGNLHCCDECPISMHFDCIKGLGLSKPTVDKDWYCPFCLSRKAAQEAAEAEKAAVAAKEKLKAFKIESRKRQSSLKEKAAKQCRLRGSSMQPKENDRALKPKQHSDESPKLRATEAHQGPSPSKASLVLTLSRKSSRQLNQLGDQDSARSSPGHKSPSNRAAGDKNASDGGRASPRVNEQLTKGSSKSLVKDVAGSVHDASARSAGDVKVPHQMRPPHDHQKASRRDPLSASTSAERARPGRRREIAGDEDDEDLGADGGEKFGDRNHVAFCSGRRKLPGLRRTPLPWTRQEEFVLKEGVKRFSQNGLWGFQWKRILEYGQGRFDPSRTCVDLKDKWRNLVKGVS